MKNGLHIRIPHKKLRKPCVSFFYSQMFNIKTATNQGSAKLMISQFENLTLRLMFKASQDFKDESISQSTSFGRMGRY